MGVSLRRSFINHMEHYEIIGCYQRCYDAIHTSNNGLTHNNCIVTWKYVSTRQICKKQKIIPHRHDISRISDSTISTSHSIRYEINCNSKTILKCVEYMKTREVTDLAECWMWRGHPDTDYSLLSRFGRWHLDLASKKPQRLWSTKIPPPPQHAR